MKTLVALIIAAALSGGCTHTSVELPNGGKFSRTSLFNSQSVGNVTVRTSGENAGVTIDGYNSQQTEVAAKALGLATAALGAK